MANRYTLRNIDTAGDPTGQRSLATTMLKLNRRLKRNTQGPWRLEYGGEMHALRPSRFDTVRRVDRLMRQDKGPDRIIVHAAQGPRYAVKEYPQTVTPPPDGPGTRGIDVIHAAVHTKFGRGSEYDWRIAELGICVDKPGEHGACNAWDGGVLRDENGNPLPADEVHRRITVVANWLQAQGKLHISTNGREGLPVNGVIWLQSYWERGNEGARPYGGTFHATHWHVSAHPSVTGWV